MGFAKKILKTGLFVGGVLGALAIYNKVTESMAGELDTVLTGEEQRYAWKYGDLFYSVKGKRDAKPLVLLHDVAAPGASSYEWRKNVDVLAEHFRVYTPDLLGFGTSDRPAIDYDGELFANLISDFLNDVVKRPAIVIAHGLTSAFVISEAYRRPRLFERLILVAPPPTILQEVNLSSLHDYSRSILSLPIVGEFLYNLQTTRGAIRRQYDKQGYHNPDLITDELVEYLYTSAHQSNSRFVQAAVSTDYLRLDVHDQLAGLQMPVVVVWGREGALLPSEASAAFKRVNPHVEVCVLDKAMSHVQEEQAQQFNKLVREFANAAVK
jgi:pimeloyl-ACP methyl ester carboxylesterase